VAEGAAHGILAGQSLVEFRNIVGRRIMTVCRWGYRQELEALFQAFPAKAVAKKAIIPDAHEAVGQDVKKESPDKLPGLKSHDAASVVVAVILPSEGYRAVFQFYQAIIGDGDPVRIAGEVIEHLLGAPKWRFGINDPFGMAALSKGFGEDPRLGKILERTVKLQLALLEGPAQAFEKQATEQTGENTHGKEELSAGGDPATSVRGKTSTRNETVQVGVMEQGLPPGVQDGNKADLGTHTLGVGSDAQQGL